MASTYLSRTMGTATNRNIFTLSMWAKLSKIGSDLNDYQFCDFYVSGTIRISLYHNDDDTLRCHMEGGGSYTNNLFTTSAKLRDKNAWYHLVWRFDTTQASASDRVRVYINGELAGFSDYNAPAQNFNLQQGTSSYTQYIGRYGGNTDNNFDGLMSHIHFCDGYSYDASSFGETDSTTGEWKIKTSPSVTYGNNGFFILKDGNSVTDQSGNGNNFTVGGGTLTKTEDCPSNVFATANALTNLHGSATYSEGNLKVSGSNAANNVWQTTLGVSSGKWYWELKNLISDNDLSLLFYDQSIISGSHPGYGFVCSTRKKIINGSVTGSGIGSSAQNDIWSMALDLDNGKMFIARNGTYLESGNPSTGANPFIQTSDGLPSEGVIGGHVYNGSVELNFGNGYFGTTAVSSAGTNASGNGIFEYDVPTGYTALSTKGLNL